MPGLLRTVLDCMGGCAPSAPYYRYYYRHHFVISNYRKNENLTTFFCSEVHNNKQHAMHDSMAQVVYCR
jgi:hypothetical protein